MRYEQSLAPGQRPTITPVRAGALVGLGVALWHLGDYPARAHSWNRRSRCVVRHGNRRSLASAYNNLGLVQQLPAGSAAARAVRIEHALLIARETGHLTLAATTLMNLGNLALEFGRLRRRQGTLCGRAGGQSGAWQCWADRRHTAQSGCCFVRSWVSSRRRWTCYVEAERLYVALNSQADLGYTSNGRGDIAFQQGDYATSTRLL